MSAGIKSDAANTVVDRRVVAVAPVHLERASVRESGRVVRARLFSADPKWIIRIEILYVMILDVNLRHAVVGSRQQKAMVKPYLKRARL